MKQYNLEHFHEQLNSEHFHEQLNSMPWEVLDNMEDPNDMWKTLQNMFLQVADKCAPWMKCRVNGYDAPWMTGEIRQMINERDKVKTLANKTQNGELMERYKELRNKVTKQCRIAKDEYYNTLVLENLDNEDRLWKALHKVLPQTQKSSHINSFKEGSTIHTSNKDIASRFNQFFSRMVLSLLRNLETQVQQNTKCRVTTLLLNFLK